MRLLFYLFTVALLTSFVFPQEQSLPIDPAVKIGKLSNGLTYYIHKNGKPENRCELRLVVNAGSVLESDEQKGLAHFVEHMAFNGSKNFKKNELISYLESIGVKFGPDLNAYTSFDETVYMLQVATDNKDILSKAFLVLHDWAVGLSFDSTEVEKERGVISEEWRLGRGASARMMDKQFPILFTGSKYAERMPIGDIDVIKNFKHQTLIDFYKTWYRPDLMAVIAVGDFNPEDIEVLIREKFAGIESYNDKKERIIFDVPKHSETLYAIASDKEWVYSNLAIYTKQESKPTKTVADYKERIISSLFTSMINERFSEILRLPDPPFIQAGFRQGRFVKSADVNYLFAAVNDGEISKGMETLLREAERVRAFGFTQTELDRHKQIRLRAVEQQLAEKDKTESSNIIGGYVSHFLNNTPILGIDTSYKLYSEIIPVISLADVNKLAPELLASENRVVLVSVPEKENLPKPTEAELNNVLEKVSTEKLSAYEDKVQSEPLVSNIPIKSSISKETQNQNLGISELTLQNGIKIILKKTDFKNDEVIIRAFSPGGNSLIDDKDYIAAMTTNALISESGLGKFTKNELTKYLSGKIIRLNPFISTYSEGISGNCSPKDIETLLQLVYLYFTSPRIDSSAYLSYRSKIKTMLTNYGNDPQSVFYDTIGYALNNYHFRSRPTSLSLLDEMNMSVSENFFKDRFADASDFTFLFVGNIEPESLKPLLEKYIGGLPCINRNENWEDIKMTNPEGFVEKIVYKGLEPKSMVSISYTGEFDWSRENEYKFESLMDVINIRLREVIREEKGGTYGIKSGFELNRIPKSVYTVTISWGCNPERVDELIEAMNQTIDSIKTYGINEETLNKVKETQKRSRETNVKRNSFWAGLLYNFYLYGDNPELVLNYNKWIEELSLDDIKTFAKTYLKGNNEFKAILYPEKK